MFLGTFYANKISFSEKRGEQGGTLAKKIRKLVCAKTAENPGIFVPCGPHQFNLRVTVCTVHSGKHS